MSFASPESSPSISQTCIVYEKLQQQLKDYNVPPTTRARKQEIMNLLHDFNDVKDAAQIVIGALANMDGKTIKEIHLCYNLPLNE